MMRKIALKILLATSVAFFINVSYAEKQKLQNPENVVMTTVNGKKITLNFLEDMVKLSEINGATDNNDLRNNLAKDLIVREIINQEVKKSKLLDKPEIRAQVKIATDNAILEIWFSHYLQDNPIKEEEVRAEYERLLSLSKEGRNSNEYRFSQILVSTEKEANFILSRIQYGESFEKLAKEKSIDKQSSNQGGAINWTIPGQLIPPLGDILLNINKGKISQSPIQSKLGWHILRVDDIRPYRMPSYDDSKAQIFQNIAQVKRQEAIQKLIDKAKIGNKS